MAAKSHINGNQIKWVSGRWVYTDGTPAEAKIKCPRCGKLPTGKGHDACLGELYGVVAACCGHGIGTPYIMKDHT